MKVPEKWQNEVKSHKIVNFEMLKADDRSGHNTMQ